MVEGEPKILSFVVTIHGENVAVLRRRQRGADGITVSMPIGMGSVDDMGTSSNLIQKVWPMGKLTPQKVLNISNPPQIR